MTWPIVPLGEVADTALGKMLDKGKSNGHAHVPYLRNVNVQWGRIDTHDLLTMELAEEARERFGVKEGDLLVCEGGEVGRSAIWHGRTEYLAYQKALHRIRPSDRLYSHFLRYLLEHHSLSGTLAKFSTGTTIAHLPQQQLRRLPVPLPPLEEQRRIVDLLEDHLSRLDAADRYVKANVRRAANWHAGLVSRWLWSPDYPLVSVGSILREPMRNGRSDRAIAGNESGVRTLTLTAVTKNSFTVENTKTTITTAERAASLWLEPGDVFVQRSNTPELVGTTARYNGPRDWAIFPDLLIRLRPIEDRIDSRFLTAALRSEQGHRQLRSKAKGLAGSMPKIDQAAIANADIPLPSVEEQRSILLHVEAAGDALMRLEVELAAAKERSRALRRSLLAAAFSGRLTGSATDMSVAEGMIPG